MCRSIFFLITLVFLSLGKMVLAQDGLFFEYKPMYFVNIVGADIHQYDVYKYTEKGSYDFATGQYNIDYGVRYAPGVTKPKAQFVPMSFGALYRKGSLTFKLSGWYLEAKDIKGGLVETPAGDWDDYPYNYKYDIWGVKMYNQPLIPVWNDFHSSGFSPVKYWAENKLSLTNLEVAVMKELLTLNDTKISVGTGLRYVAVKHKRVEGQSQNAFITNYWGYGYNYDNMISLNAVSSAKNEMVGPMVIFKGSWGKKIGVEAETKFAFLMGSSQQKGNWRDIDSIVIRVGSPFLWDTTLSYAMLDGNPFSASFKNKLAGWYHEVNIGFFVVFNKSLTLNMGVSTKNFSYGASPAWVIEGDWAAIGGGNTGWGSKKNKIVISNAFLNLQAKIPNFF